MVVQQVLKKDSIIFIQSFQQIFAFADNIYLFNYLKSYDSDLSKNTFQDVKTSSAWQTMLSQTDK